MIYVYEIQEWDYRTMDESIEEMKIRNYAIENCKELKMMHYEDYVDEYVYIGKENYFTYDGKTYMADCTLDDWIERYIDYEESELDVSTLSIHDFCFSNQGAIDILTDEIKNEDSDLGYMYMDRIFNSEDPYTEIRKVIDEITILILEQTIDELKEQVSKMEHIDWK